MKTPHPVAAIAQARGAARKAALFSAAVGVFVASGTYAAAQGPQPLAGPLPHPRRAHVPRHAELGNPSAAAPNPTGLLHHMVKASEAHAFVAREVMLNANGQETEQIVRWDPKLGLRRESVRPKTGDLLIDNFKMSYVYSLHERRWTQQNSLLPHQGGRISDVLKRIKSGDVRAEWVGQEEVAGRVADIVRVVPSMSGPAPTRKFWIDRATGVRLKSEDIGIAGRTLATSYYLSLDIDPQIDAHLFDAPVVSAGTLIIRNAARKFPTLDAARAAGVSVHAPDYLPAGFALRVVESGSNVREPRVTLRYTNGITLLSIIATPKQPFGRKIGEQLGPDGSGFLNGPRGLRAYLWHDNASNQNFAVLSSLPDDQIKRVADSVR